MTDRFDNGDQVSLNIYIRITGWLMGQFGEKLANVH